MTARRSTGVALLVAASVAVVALPTQADEPQGAAGSAMGGALMKCKSFMKTTKSPGLLSYEDYADYRRRMMDAVAVDPTITTKVLTWDKPYLSYFVPKDQYPLCTKFVAAYERGVDAELQPSLYGNCEGNVDKNLAAARSQMAQWRADKSTNRLWQIRRNIEASRFMLYLDTAWRQPLGQSCAPNDRYKRAFRPVAARFKAAEAEVTAFEAAAGLSFEGVENENTIVIVDVATGQRVHL